MLLSPDWTFTDRMLDMVCYPAAVTVGFEMDTYTVGEETRMVNVCLNVNATRERIISVTLTTNKGTGSKYFVQSNHRKPGQ